MKAGGFIIITVVATFQQLAFSSRDRVQHFQDDLRSLLMTEPKPPFLKRLALALRVFWRTLANPDFAADLAMLDRGELPGGLTQVAEARPVSLKEPLPDSALQMLGLLQQDGRFVDFLEENVSHFTDAEIGGAARVVHEGCRKVLREHMLIEPVRSEQEGAPITLEKGFDASAVRLSGNVVGQPPFTGTLMHRGWRVSRIKLPKLAEGHDVRILAPAEVEL
jgi:hypothetical protein